MAQAHPADVAKFQKFLLYAILASISVNIASRLIPDSLLIPLFIIALVIAITSLVLVIKLTTAMGWATLHVVLSAVAMFIPLINLITLIVINLKAIKILRAAGYQVGLLGAKGV